MKTKPPATLDAHLDTLRLPFLKEHCRPLAATAAKNSLTHLDYLAQLIEGEAGLRADRAVARRIRSARFPVIKTLDTFRWDWPKKINRLQIQDLFRLQFIEDHANVILLGTGEPHSQYSCRGISADDLPVSSLLRAGSESRATLPSGPCCVRRAFRRHARKPAVLDVRSSLLRLGESL